MVPTMFTSEPEFTSEFTICLAYSGCSVSICLLIDGKVVLSSPVAKTPFLTQLVAISQVGSRGLRLEARLP